MFIVNQLISALFSLSRASQETANATVDFYNSLSGSNQDLSASLIGLAANVTAAAADMTTAAAAVNSGLSTVPISSEFSGHDTVYGSTPLSTDLDGSAIDPQDPKKSKSKSKRPRKAVDPNAPRKPTTSYFLFAAEERDKIRNERISDANSPLRSIDMTTEIARRWNSIGKDGQEHWRQVYMGRFAKYRAEKKVYEAKLALENLKPGESVITIDHASSSESDPENLKEKVINTDTVVLKSKDAAKRKASADDESFVKKSITTENPTQASDEEKQASTSVVASSPVDNTESSEPSKKKHKKSKKNKEKKNSTK